MNSELNNLNRRFQKSTSWVQYSIVQNIGHLHFLLVLVLTEINSHFGQIINVTTTVTFYCVQFLLFIHYHLIY